jgi:hypothetical protein
MTSPIGDVNNNISVGIAMAYKLDGRGSILHNVLTSFWTQPVSTEDFLSQGVKWPVREGDYSPTPSAEAKNEGAISPLPHTPS